jgi:hypothetical protein
VTFVLQVRRRIKGDLDRHNNPTVTWSDPTPWTVRALAPGASSEPTEPNRDASLIVWTIYSDASADVPGEHDRVVVLGEEFEVVGRPSDWTKGPWHHPTAGVVTELQRWEG